MEKIRINSIEKKGVVCIVKYVQMFGNGVSGAPLEATLNINFNSQEISYLENDVGKGGTVSVEIKENKGKNGQTYINITKVDFDSAVKQKPAVFGPNAVHYQEVHDGVRSVNGQEQKSAKKECGYGNIFEVSPIGSADKNKSIIAQCLVKAVIGAMTAASVPISVKQAVNMYKEALELIG